MTRVLTRGKSLGPFGLCVAAAIATACAGKALDVGSDSTAGGDDPGTGATSVGAGGAGTGATGSGTGATAAMGSGTGATAAMGNGTGATAAMGSGATGATSGMPPVLSDEDLDNIQWPAAQPCAPAPESPLVGTWKGFWQYDDRQADEAVLTITGLTPDGVPCGTFRVGEGEPPPPPTDPNAIYPEAFPPGYQPAYPFGMDAPGMANPIIDPWPGYEYELLKVISEGSRLAFVLSFGEILRPWCQMQSSSPDSLSCLPHWTGGGSTDTPGLCTISGPSLAETEVPCWKTYYCSSATCFCYEGECDAALNVTALELHWDDAALEGTVNGKTLIFLDPVAP
jgi:hypothetical protein